MYTFKLLLLGGALLFAGLSIASTIFIGSSFGGGMNIQTAVFLLLTVTCMLGLFFL